MLLWVYAIVGGALIISFTLIALIYPGDKGIVFAALTVLAGVIFAQIKTAQTSANNSTDLKVVKADLAENNDTTAKVLDTSEKLVTQVADVGHPLRLASYRILDGYTSVVNVFVFA